MTVSSVMPHSRTACRPVAISLLVGALLAGCAASGSTPRGGTLRGYLEMMGGPLIVVDGKVSTPHSGVPGRVFLLSSRGVRVSIAVPTSGRFTARLPAGTYGIWGGPRDWDFRGCGYPGRTRHVEDRGVSTIAGTLIVTQGHTAVATLVCAVP